MAKKKVSFEEALKELESVIEKLEDENITLDDSVDEFSKGVKAVKECRTSLDKAKGKIIKLIEKDGEFIEKELGITIDSLIGGE